MWRTVTLALAVAGCNQVFGLHETAPRDGAPDGPDAPPDAMWPRLVLMRQVLDGTTITTTWSASDPPPTTKVGPIGGELRDVLVADDGGLLLPSDLLAAPYRIVYQVGNGTPTEIQSSGTTGTFTVPLFGRADRTNAPPGAVLHFGPSLAPASLPNARVLTAGLWTRQDVGLASNSYDFAYTGTQSLSGALGSLDGSRGDVEVLTAGLNSSDPGASTGFAVMQVASLLPNAPVTAPSTWTSPTPLAIPVTFNETVPGNMLGGALGNLQGNGPNALHGAGALASNAMPTFTEPVPGDLDLAAYLPLDETTGTTSQLTFVNPFDGGHAPAPMLPLAVAGRFTRARSFDGAQLVSGYQEIATYGGLAVMVSYDVGLAKDVTLAGTALSGNLVTGDGVTITAAGATLPLVFATDLPVDDCVITISSIASGVVTPKYRYLIMQVPTPQAPLQLDRALFQGGTDYVIGLVCRRGSRTGTDYSLPTYPFRTSTLQSAVFHVM